MELYFIRHADALALGDGDVTEDANRPLSEAGIAQARSLGRAMLRKDVQLKAVFTSPLLRARQTGEQIVEQWGQRKPELKLCEEMAPGVKPKKLARFLRSQGGDAFALVGHQPDLSNHVAWLIGSKKAQVDFAKGGMAQIVCSDQPRKGSGVLLCLVAPEWLGS